MSTIMNVHYRFTLDLIYLKVYTPHDIKVSSGLQDNFSHEQEQELTFTNARSEEIIDVAIVRSVYILYSNIISPYNLLDNLLIGKRSRMYMHISVNKKPICRRKQISIMHTWPPLHLILVCGKRCFKGVCQPPGICQFRTRLF